MLNISKQNNRVDFIEVIDSNYNVKFILGVIKMKFILILWKWSNIILGILYGCYGSELILLLLLDLVWSIIVNEGHFFGLVEIIFMTNSDYRS